MQLHTHIRTSRRSGFSLFELILTLVFFGFMTFVLSRYVSTSFKAARESAAKQNAYAGQPQAAHQGPAAAAAQPQPVDLRTRGFEIELNTLLAQLRKTGS